MRRFGQHDLHRIPLARLQRRRRGMAAAVAEVEHAVAHPGRRAVRRDIAEAHANQGLRFVRSDLQRGDGRTDDASGSVNGSVSKTSDPASSIRWSSGISGATLPRL